MFKEIKSVKSGVSKSALSSEAVASLEVPACADPSFIGYSKSPKGHTFRSDLTRHKPVLSPAPPEEWIEDSPSELTTRYRRDFHTYLKVSLDVKSYQMRPVVIPFVDSSGLRREYRPLFLLNYWTDDGAPKNRRNLLADIRSDADIRKDADWFIPAWRAASRFANYKRLDFRVFRDSFFLSDYFANMQFMDNYRWLEPHEENWRLINRILKDKNYLTFADLLQEGSTNKDEDYRRRLIRSIWTLVAMGCVSADWSKRFNTKTILWLNWIG